MFVINASKTYLEMSLSFNILKLLNRAPFGEKKINLSYFLFLIATHFNRDLARETGGT